MSTQDGVAMKIERKKTEGEMEQAVLLMKPSPLTCKEAFLTEKTDFSSLNTGQQRSETDECCSVCS